MSDGNKMERTRAIILWVRGYVIALNCIFLPCIATLVMAQLGVEIGMDTAVSYFMVSALLGTILALVCYVVSMVLLILAIQKSREHLELVTLLNKCCILVKLGSIPYFVVNFLFFVIMTAAFGNPFLFVLMPAVALTGMVIAAMALVTTSSYTITTYLVARYRKMITTKSCIFLILTQCIFVLDIIGACIGAYVIRKKVIKCRT